MNKFKIPKTGFPSQTASNEEKNTNEFGYTVAKAIMHEWFSREHSSNCRFYTNRDNYRLLKLYARGQQPVQKYKTELSANGDLSFTNLDWTPVPIIPKFVDIIVNGMSDRGYKVNAYATDSIATTDRENYIQELRKDMLAKPVLSQLQNEFGVNGFSNDPMTLPETDEELEVHMELNYKQNIEVAEEVSINTILDLNDYRSIKKQVDYDLAVLGIGAMKREFNIVEGIKLNHVDPEDLVYSYSESPYMDDCYYVGEVKRVSIGDIKRINPNLTKEELESIQKGNYQWNDYQGFTNSEEIDGTVNVLYFTYRTSNELVYKKKQTRNGGEKIIKRDQSFEAPKTKDAKFERISKTIDVEYNGAIVLGTEFLLKWELSENMIRPKSAIHKLIPTYSIVRPRTYNGSNESPVQRMIPFADLIQLAHLKLQQVLAKIVPDGVYIDADGLSEIDLGDGNAYNPTKALELYLQTGSVIGRSSTMDGEFNHGSIPIKELTNNSGQQKITALITTYQHYLQSIRDVTGLNEAVDASTPSPEALVGVQKLAILNSNTALRHILEAGLHITKNVSLGISYMISDMLEIPSLRNSFINSIGKVNVSILEDIKKLNMHDFGIFIELSPDEEEKAKLEARIQMALSTGELDLADSIDISEIRNVKLANQLLKIRRKRKLREEMEKQQAAIESQAKANEQLALKTAEAKQAEIKAEADNKIAIDTNLKKLERENREHEAALKLELMQKEFEFNMQLKGLEVKGKKDLEKEKEDRKDKRQDRNNTQASKMIEQRKKENSSSLNFESEEDSLDGFSLNSFDPR